MNPEKDYLAINKNSWNKRTEIHVESEFYDVPSFLNGKSSLNSIELNLLGDIKGKSILHLQCHFGQDSISLQRMGAKVTGVDLSDVSIAKARELAKKAGFEPTFICCDVYDLPAVLTDQFDLVFTSYGTIGWLPDLTKWANVISSFLKPNGKFVFVEFHPVVWMFDDSFRTIGYNYFNTGPIVETESGTYTNREAELVQEYVCWNHGIAEVLTSLLTNGLALKEFQEFNYSPYNCFAGTVELEPKRYRIQHLEDKIPMVYGLVAEKN
ncbi:MAG: SAM-dependent methyltransferase [Bacteroidetes bacterium B1(2017)]|nr:MAG: SAM-dependent methyltransferase [Bacteroidetes bacterium B1(2017)]